MSIPANTKFVVCVNNDDYPASLEIRKIYRTLPDSAAKKHNLIRVIDESSEDYLYPESCFILIELTEEVEKALLATA